jgi:hypothetical protein
MTTPLGKLELELSMTVDFGRGSEVYAVGGIGRKRQGLRQRWR